MLKKFLARPEPFKMLFVRTAESSGNLSGTLWGWMDAELTDFGRKQAFSVNSDVLIDYEDEFDSFHSSDLKRSCQTAQYALGFPSESLVKQNRLLRECNFGLKEGAHFDSMSDQEKEKLSSPDYQYPEGESFNDVHKRALMFLKQQSLGKHLIFTHGGIIWSLLQNFGVEQMPENWSFLGTIIDEDTKNIKELEFVWEFPTISEDI